MTDHAWIKEFAGSVTVCDTGGTILELNDTAAAAYAADGGYALIGRSLLDCHGEESRRKVERLLASRQANIYTVEKHGVRKLIYQAPWYEHGEYAGMVELALVIPAELPHLVRA